MASGELGRDRSAFRVAALVSHRTLHSVSLTSVARVCASPSLVALILVLCRVVLAVVWHAWMVVGRCVGHVSCWHLWEVTHIIRVWGTGMKWLGGTKPTSTSPRSGVWRPLDGPSSVGDELSLDH